MKSLKYLLLGLLLTSCVHSVDKREFGVRLVNSGGWSTSTVYCDSVQMLSPNKAEVFIDGRKMTVFAEEVKIFTN